MRKLKKFLLGAAALFLGVTGTAAVERNVSYWSYKVTPIFIFLTISSSPLLPSSRLSQITLFGFEISL